MAWWRTVGRQVYHAMPARFWHSVDGLKRDVQSLPVRFSDPDRRADPWEVIHHVGGDFRSTGLAGVAMLRDFGGLKLDDQVLDIGCGNGRMTLPLTEALGSNGGYIGFDVSLPAIRYCRRRFGPIRPQFRFEHLDIYNEVYNRAGVVPESEARFPAADGSITLAFATSILTHLPMAAIRHYIKETRRVLAPGGRALLTAYVLTPQVRAWALAGRTNPPMRPLDDGAMAIDPHWPLNGIAYDAPLFRACVEEAGLTLEAIHYGQWRPEATYQGGQDLLVVRG